MIPKVIHCCWFGGPKTKLAEKCRASWERFALDWEIREWGVESLEKTEVPSFALDAIAARKWAVVSDWMRMWALYQEGGIYLDFDVELIRPFDPPEGEWVSGEWTADGGVWMNPGSGIALEKGSAVARYMLESYAHTAFDPRREMMRWINARLRETTEGKNFRVLPPEVFSPIDAKGVCHQTIETLGIHHYAMSWASPSRQIAKWLSWHGMRGVVDWLIRMRGRVAAK